MVTAVLLAAIDLLFIHFTNRKRPIEVTIFILAVNHNIFIAFFFYLKCNNITELPHSIQTTFYKALNEWQPRANVFDDKSRRKLTK